MRNVNYKNKITRKQIVTQSRTFILKIVDKFNILWLLLTNILFTIINENNQVKSLVTNVKLIIRPQTYLNRDNTSKQVRLYTKLVIFSTIIKLSSMVNLDNRNDKVDDFQ